MVRFSGGGGALNEGPYPAWQQPSMCYLVGRWRHTHEVIHSFVWMTLIQAMPKSSETNTPRWWHCLDVPLCCHKYLMTQRMDNRYHVYTPGIVLMLPGVVTSTLWHGGWIIVIMCTPRLSGTSNMALWTWIDLVNMCTGILVGLNRSTSTSTTTVSIQLTRPALWY